ncbi:hypothetical protein T10_11670 [Trichinella papuae]|uniref:Uncharacterized protein n=1 Tax=Trichinella papuae TaxID=268474 RepID=A0A0V1M9V1_9BILA|nr:hypothetical protein T10_11670 [Trichinella papuae]
MDVAVYGFHNTNKNEQTIIAIFSKKNIRTYKTLVNKTHKCEIYKEKNVSEIQLHHNDYFVAAKNDIENSTALARYTRLHGDDLLAIKMISHIHMHCIGNMGSIETLPNGIKRKFSQSDSSQI